MTQAVAAIDARVLEYLVAVREPFTSVALFFVTMLGDWLVVYAFSAAIAWWLLLKGRKADAAGLAVSVLSTGAVILLLKFFVHRMRPPLEYQFFPDMAYYSFPSAHAGLSMAFFGFLAYLLLQTYSTLPRRILLICVPLIILLVGFSRLYLGVHFLSDVLAGFAIGAFFVWAGRVVRIRLLA
jgi:undecaprenyl-diphosphatase